MSMPWSNSINAVLLAQKCSRLACESGATLAKILTLARRTLQNSEILNNKAVHISKFLSQDGYKNRLSFRAEVSACLVLNRKITRENSLFHVEIIRLLGGMREPWLQRELTIPVQQNRNLAIISEEIKNLLQQIPSHVSNDDAFYINIVHMAKIADFNKSLAYDALKSAELVQSQMILITRTIESQLYDLGE